MPLPVFERSELAKMSVIAYRNKDAKLLEFVYQEVKDSVLAQPTPSTLSEVKGKALIARMEMLKAADRLKATIEYGDYRQLPITDTQGLTYTTSVRRSSRRAHSKRSSDISQTPLRRSASDKLSPTQELTT
jgi:hypothetical protein